MQGVQKAAAEVRLWDTAFGTHLKTQSTLLLVLSFIIFKKMHEG